MYINRLGLLALFGGGIFVTVLVALFVFGQQALAVNLVGVGAFLAVGAFAGWLIARAARRVTQAAVLPSPREYLTGQRKFTLPRFWALRLLSGVLKVLAVFMLLAGIVGFIGLLLASGATLNTMTGSVPLNALFPTASLPLLAIPLAWGALLAYAFAHFIDLMLNVESHLSALSNRRRPSSNEPS